MTEEREELKGTDIWFPENKGDQLVGVVKEVITDGEFGTQHVIEKSDGSTLRTPSHKVLQSRLSQANVGDKLEINFVGEEPPAVKGHSPTKMYSVFRNP